MEQFNIREACAVEVKPIPKSLHTVRVLSTMARLIVHCDQCSNESAIEQACIALGYADAPDVHQLKAKAAKAMAIPSNTCLTRFVAR